MMKKLCTLLSLFLVLNNLLPPETFAAISNSERAQVEYGNNLLTNGGFENGLSKWTASSTSTLVLSSTAASVFAGSYSGAFDATSAAQTVIGEAVTGAPGTNGELTCMIRVPSGVATHTFGIWNGTTILQSISLPLNLGTSFVPVSMNFVFPPSGTVAPIFTAVASNEPLINIDKCYLGPWRNGGNAQVQQPTITTKISGSGTYTPPAGASYIHVKMVGGGGGGAGSGTGTSGGTGGIGGATTFGTSLLNANGGAGGQIDSVGGGGAGGTASIGVGATGTALSGGTGNIPANTNSSLTFQSGGIGGVNPLGGFGVSNSGSGTVNTGAGGGGAGAFGSGVSLGSGGGAGGFVDAIISNPSALAPISYTVGASGTGGTIGTSGAAGGSGAAGYIEITEYYGSVSTIATNAMFDSTGMTTEYDGTNCPSGTLLEDGSAVSRTTYAHLFSVIGTTYGVGDGTTTFNIPDHRLVSGVGADSSTRAIGGITYPAIPLATTLNDQMQGHVHAEQVSSNSGALSSIPATGSLGTSFGTLGTGLVTGVPTSDGTNGTPRTGAYSHGPEIAKNYCMIANGVIGMPLTTGAVTSSNTSGVERLERARVSGAATDATVCTSSPCTIFRPSGNWLSSVTRASTGSYTANFSAFANIPSCFLNEYDGSHFTKCVATSITTTSAIISCAIVTSAVATDSYFDLMCMGTK